MKADWAGIPKYLRIFYDIDFVDIFTLLFRLEINAHFLSKFFEIATEFPAAADDALSSVNQLRAFSSFTFVFSFSP